MTDSQPMAVLSYTPATDHPRPRWQRAARILTLLALVVCVAGAILVPAVDVETVVVTGPALFVLAILGIVAGLRIGRTGVWAIHAGHAALCALFVVLVNVLNWSPGDAYVPFMLMSAAWSVAATVATVIVLRRQRDATTVF